MQSESRREDLALSASAQCPGAARAPTPSVHSTSPAQLRLRAQKENPAAGDGRGFRTIGRPGIGGAWRPSKPISRPPPWPGSIRRCRVYGRRYNTRVQRPDVSFRQALNRFAILARWSDAQRYRSGRNVRFIARPPQRNLGNAFHRRHTHGTDDCDAAYVTAEDPWSTVVGLMDCGHDQGREWDR
jgi:hypothetical protein